MSVRLTSEGYARLDAKKIAPDFIAECGKRGVTRYRVEGDMGLAPGTLSRLVSGKRVGMDGITLVLLCRWMDVDPREYVRIEERA